jgi:hypothetical protein
LQGHVFGFYDNVILFASKVPKQAISYATVFSMVPPLAYIHVGNAATGKRSRQLTSKCGRAKSSTRIIVHFDSSRGKIYG